MVKCASNSNGTGGKKSIDQQQWKLLLASGVMERIEKPSEGGRVQSGIRPEMRKQNVIVHIILFSKIHLTVYKVCGTMGGEGGF